MYVDLNPIRAAMAETVEQSKHTSAYDRVKSEKGSMIDSAAFDLVPVSSAEAGEKIRETTVKKLKKERKAKRKNPTGRRIRRDEWLAPLTMDRKSRADDPELNRKGLRASDKGFLDLSLSDYLRLLRWTGKQGDEEAERRVPSHVQAVVCRLGIDASMWRDLVWNFKKYFGKSCCAGSPTTMTQHAQASGRQWARGQRGIANCFLS